MIPLFVNTTDTGGAAIAAYRLLKGVQSADPQALMLVRDKTIDDVNTITPKRNMKGISERLKPHIERLPFRFYPQKQRTPFHLQWNPGVSPTIIRKINSDIIHLHWICGGFLKIESIPKLDKPIVWTLHDMWPFTGGCHYSFDCSFYERSCGNCPQLGSTKEDDLSRWVWTRKNKNWKDLSFTVVTPSKWLANCARSSSLFHNKDIKIIPNGIDTDFFRPYDSNRARKHFNLPLNKTLILFSSATGIANPLKGFDYLRYALNKFKEQMACKLELVILGNPVLGNITGIDVPIHNIGHLSDEQDIVLLYSASDLFAAPSIQDNLPNTVLEALACGTPCVAFNIGGMPDMIEHQQNGYLAQPFSREELGVGIAWVLEDNLRYRKLSNNARKMVKQKFDINTVARRYNKLYEEILS